MKRFLTESPPGALVALAVGLLFLTTSGCTTTEDPAAAGSEEPADLAGTARDKFQSIMDQVSGSTSAPAEDAATAPAAGSN